jgi:hypothetical protein
MFITCEFIPSPSLNGPPSVNNHSIKETTMTLSRKQLVVVAEFKFPVSIFYLVLRINLKLRRPEKRSAIWQFWIINYPAKYYDCWFNFCLVDGDKERSEIPSSQRRPLPITLVDYKRSNADRNTAICQAYQGGGWTLKAVGEHFDLHYSTVSGILRDYKSNT